MLALRALICSEEALSTHFPEPTFQPASPSCPALVKSSSQRMVSPCCTRASFQLQPVISAPIFPLFQDEAKAVRKTCPLTKSRIIQGRRCKVTLFCGFQATGPLAKVFFALPCSREKAAPVGVASS